MVKTFYRKLYRKLYPSQTFSFFLFCFCVANSKNLICDLWGSPARFVFIGFNFLISGLLIVPLALLSWSNEEKIEGKTFGFIGVFPYLCLTLNLFYLRNLATRKLRGLPWRLSGRATTIGLHSKVQWQYFKSFVLKRAPVDRTIPGEFTEQSLLLLAWTLANIAIGLNNQPPASMLFIAQVQLSDLIDGPNLANELLEESKF